MPEGPVVDDVALLEAWGRGERAAGAELFERYYPSVARFFHNQVSEAVQEDLIHETFLACLASAAHFRGQARFRTYLFGIAHNVLADHLRWLARRNTRLGPEADLDKTPAVSFGLSPVAAAVKHQEQRLVLEALRRIPPLHQIALELHYWEELTAAEIGEVLGVPLGTAKTRLRDGRAYLEDQLRNLASSSEALRSTLDDLRAAAPSRRREVTSRQAEPEARDDVARG